MLREEIQRMRLARNHLLSPAEPVRVTQDLCGLQAQFAANAVHALMIRSLPFDELPQQLIKSWTIRGTMHLFAKEDLPLMLHRDRKQSLRPCDTLNADELISGERKRFFARVIVNAVGEGLSEREKLKEKCFAAGMTEQEAESVFNAWGGLIRALCEQGVICHKTQGKKAFERCTPFEPMEKEQAELELARRYFRHYGPATVRDAAYFFSATQAKVKAWMAKLPLEHAQYEGRTYYWLGNADLKDAELPECLFLAGFDPLMLGYQKTESLFLPKESLRGVFSLAGIVMPTVLLRGRVKARWKKENRKVKVTPFEKLTPADLRAMEVCAAETWHDFDHLVITVV